MRTKLTRILAILLILTMIPFYAVAFDKEDAAKLGYDEFVAYEAANSYFQYIIDDYVNPAEIFIKKWDNNPWAREMLLDWEIFTFDGESAAKRLTKQIGYYDSILMDIIFTPDPNNGTDAALSIAEEALKSIDKNELFEENKYLKAIMEADASILKQDHELSSDDVAVILNKIRGTGDAYKSTEILSDLSELLEYCEDARDLIKKITRLQLIQQYDEACYDVLEDLQNLSSDNAFISPAMKDYKIAISKALADTDLATLFIAEEGAKVCLKKIGEIAWKGILSTITSYGPIILAGQAAGKYAANMLMNTEDMLSAFYKMRAAYNVESLLRQEVKNCRSRFEKDPTKHNAKKLTISLKYLLNACLETMDATKDYLDESYGTGAINDIRSGMESLWGTEDTYEAYHRELYHLANEADIIRKACNRWNNTMADMSYKYTWEGITGIDDYDPTQSVMDSLASKLQSNLDEIMQNRNEKKILQSIKDGTLQLIDTNIIYCNTGSFPVNVAWTENDLCGALAMLSLDFDNDGREETLLVSLDTEDYETYVQISIWEEESQKSSKELDTGMYTYTGQPNGNIWDCGQENVLITQKDGRYYIILYSTNIGVWDIGMIEVYEYNGSELMFVDAFAYTDTGVYPSIEESTSYVYQYTEERPSHKDGGYWMDREKSVIRQFGVNSSLEDFSKEQRKEFFETFAEMALIYGLNIQDDIRYDVNLPEPNVENGNLLAEEVVKGENIIFVGSLQLGWERRNGKTVYYLRRVDFTDLHE